MRSQFVLALRQNFTHRSLAQMTGRMPEGMLEPLEVFAHTPALLHAYAGLEQAAAGLTRVDRRLRLLAELKAATLTHCEYCIDLGSQVARRSGLSDAHLLALPSYRSSPLFTETEKLVLDYAVAMSRRKAGKCRLTGALVRRLRQPGCDAYEVEGRRNQQVQQAGLGQASIP